MYSYNLVNPVQAYKYFQQAWKDVKIELLAGKRKVMTIIDYDEALTAQQRKYYHGYVLTTIAQQVAVEGRKYAMPVWKDHYRATFLKDKVVEVTDVKTGATKKELQRVSSESLGVKGYNKLIEQVTADASTEWGVVFDVNFSEWRELQDEQ